MGGVTLFFLFSGLGVEKDTSRAGGPLEIKLKGLNV
jgi:hypothetical protein